MINNSHFNYHSVFVASLLLILPITLFAYQNESSEIEVRELLAKSGMTHHLYELQQIKSMFIQMAIMQTPDEVHAEIQSALKTTDDINKLEQQFALKLAKKLDKHIVRENLQWWKSSQASLLRNLASDSTSQSAQKHINQLRKKPITDIASKEKLNEIDAINKNTKFSDLQFFKYTNMQTATEYYKNFLEFENTEKPVPYRATTNKSPTEIDIKKNFNEHYKYTLLFGLKNSGDSLTRDFVNHANSKNSKQYYNAFFEVYKDIYQQQIRSLSNATYISAKKFSETVLKPKKETYLKYLTEQIDNQTDLHKVKPQLHIFKLSYDNPAIYCELARIELIQGSRQVQTINIVEPGYFSEGSLQKAEAYLDKALELDNKRANTYVLYGYLSFHMRDLNKANKMLDKAEKLGTNSPWLKSNRADVYFYESVTTNDQKKKKIAIQLYNDILSNKANILNSRKSAARKLSRYYIKAKQYDDADKLFRTRIKLSQEHPWIMQEYAAFLLDHRQNTDGAIIYARKALEKRNFLLGKRFLAQALVVKASQELLINKNKASAQKLFEEAKTVYPDLTNLIPYLSLSKTKFVGVRGIYALTGTAPQADNHGTTVLHYTVMSKDYDNVKEVLTMGVDPNTISTEHGTALHSAIFSNNTHVVELLLKNGANPTIPYRDGRTPIEIAKTKENKDIYNLLTSYTKK